MAISTWQARADNLRKWLEHKQPIVIYGASILGKESYDTLNQIYDLNVDCFLDMDPLKIGTTIDDIEIKDPTTFADKEACIIVASVFTEEICPWLAQQGFTNYHIYLAAYIAQPIYREAILQIENKMADQISRQTLSDLMAYYFGLRTTPPRSAYPQYIHPAISYDQQSCIIDGGAYDGDSARLFKSHYGVGCQIYAFEPNGEKFLELLEYTKSQQSVTPIHSGLWHETGNLIFQRGGAYAGRLLDSHEDYDQKQVDIVSVTAIDDMEKSTPIDLIKMDIEGAELAALNGAYRTIASDQPNLAICIYHKPEDWITIPQFMMDKSEKHEFHIGHHSHNLFETVFYAIRK